MSEFCTVLNQASDIAKNVWERGPQATRYNQDLSRSGYLVLDTPFDTDFDRSFWKLGKLWLQDDAIRMAQRISLLARGCDATRVNRRGLSFSNTSSISIHFKGKDMVSERIPILERANYVVFEATTRESKPIRSLRIEERDIENRETTSRYEFTNQEVYAVSGVGDNSCIALSPADIRILSVLEGIENTLQWAIKNPNQPPGGGAACLIRL